MKLRLHNFILQPSSFRLFLILLAALVGLGGGCKKLATPPRLPPRAPATPAPLPEPLLNSLGMRFLPVPGTRVLISVWETRVQDYAAFAQETQRKWPKPGFEQGPTHPAVDVSWADATAFCAWLSQREKRTYRLPTDAEWSLAAGLGEEEGATPAQKSHVSDGFPWGSAWPPPPGAGNYAPSLHIDDFPKTAPVGSFPANRLGLHDLGGNAWEWCADWLDPGEKMRVLRGGSWINGSRTNLRAAERSAGRPESQVFIIGFRCVLVPPEGE